jgi:hypothetical protein
MSGSKNHENDGLFTLTIVQTLQEGTIEHFLTSVFDLFITSLEETA